MLQFERQAWSQGHHRLAGVDEAGRGPLAGPVVASAVVFKPEFIESEAQGLFAKLNDSKKLSVALRDHFFELLTHSPNVEFGVGMAEVREIDSINILQATHKAMARALAQLSPVPQHALVDGRPVPNLPCPSTAIVQGDSKSFPIAAASVIAKVTRDRIMIELDKEFPAYGFARHKGYGTADHMEALRRHGPCPHHRRSFEPVAQTSFPF